MTSLSQTQPGLLELGQACLDHLVADPPGLARFMDVAGYDPAGLRAALGSEALARGLVDYFAQNESLMLTVCAGASVRPEDFMRIWAAHNRSA